MKFNKETFAAYKAKRTVGNDLPLPVKYNPGRFVPKPTGSRSMLEEKSIILRVPKGVRNIEIVQAKIWGR